MSRTTNRRHLKRLAAPSTWPIPRKASKWIVKPSPGPHSIKLSMPLLVWIRDYLKYAKNSKEAKYIIYNKKVLVDGRPVKDYAFPVGVFDVISFPDLNEHYRVLINKNEKLFLHPIDEKEANMKVLRVKNKQIVNGGKVQLTLFDGRNILVEDPKKYKTGDSFVIKVPDQKIVEYLPMEKGALLYFYFGAKAGTLGKFKELKVERKCYGNTRFVIYEDLETGETKQTIWEYAVVVGKDKPIISIPK